MYLYMFYCYNTSVAAVVFANEILVRVFGVGIHIRISVVAVATLYSYSAVRLTLNLECYVCISTHRTVIVSCILLYLQVCLQICY
jgi:hypothetical protein